jgi:bile acid:Na+ symporter, BASS family
MDLRQITLLALQVSILSTVFGFGLNTTHGDLQYVARRPGLLARALLAVFVIMPVVAVALVRMFNFSATVEIVLVALAISPVPPLLPKRETEAGGQTSFGLGLMAILALVSIVAVPVAVEILERYFGRPFAMAPGAVAAIVLKAALVPLAAGMAVRAILPTVAERLEAVVTLVAKVLLPLAIVALLLGTFSAIWAFVGPGTILAMVIFIAAGLGIGHVLGGPDPDHAVVLALSTACRHPAIALAIAATNFPDLRFGPLILLYLIVNAVMGIPYIRWQRRQVAAARVSAGSD